VGSAGQPAGSLPGRGMRTLPHTTSGLTQLARLERSSIWTDGNADLGVKLDCLVIRAEEREGQVLLLANQARGLPWYFTPFKSNQSDLSVVPSANVGLTRHLALVIGCSRLLHHQVT